MRSNALRICVAVLFVFVVTVGVGQVMAKKPPKPPKCPLPTCGYACTMEYAPVACDVNGKECIYSNACVAACAGQTDCVPIGPGPVPF